MFLLSQWLWYGEENLTFGPHNALDQTKTLRSAHVNVLIPYTLFFTSSKKGKRKEQARWHPQHAPATYYAVLHQNSKLCTYIHVHYTHGGHDLLGQTIKGH
jgi:hypothetical protein